MKRLIPLVLTLLVLCGCTVQPEPTGIPTAPTLTEPVPTMAPASLYNPDSPLEQATNGAVRAYPLGNTFCLGITFLGEDLLLFSDAGGSTLTKYSGDTLCVSASTQLDCCVYPANPAVVTHEKGLTYFDEWRNDLVFLDARLTEVKRLALPEDNRGTPALSTDRKLLYYCTADALRCLDLETGLDRLLKEMYFESQVPAALHCDDTVIACTTEDSAGNRSVLYISTQTGQLLWETTEETEVHTNGDFYFAVCWRGGYPELLVGDSEQGPTLLEPDTYRPNVFPLLENRAALLVSRDEDSGTQQLDYYDLRTGRRTASLTLDDLAFLSNFCIAEESDALWFLHYDPYTECETLCRWDLAQSTTGKEPSCLSARYTAEKPDYMGLAACRQTADEISAAYHVQILLWQDAVAFQPWDYTLIPEYQVPVIRENLKKLEHILSLFPSGFLETAALTTDSGRIQICLVRSIVGNDTGSDTLSEVEGLQYWDDRANAYLSLSLQQDLSVGRVCHELFHIIDSRVLTVCRAYDDWESLNPKGFEYDYDYVGNLSRSDYHWLEDKTRAFIDLYSMSYPKEDRARIMEYAMDSGNEAFFESETMQKKLRQLCLGIREAFDLKSSPEVFLWEQYLRESLAKP